MTTLVPVHGAFGSTAELAPVSLVPGLIRVDRLVYVTAVVSVPGLSIIEAVGAETGETILSVSKNDGNGCRSFDFDLLASLVPPEERDAYLAFLHATQSAQGEGVCVKGR